MSGPMRPEDPAATAGSVVTAPVAGKPDGVADAADALVRPAVSVDVALAYKQLLESRREFAAELDGLSASTKASLDIPAKVRKDPLKAAALAGGAGFLLLGGPRRAIRLAGRALPRRSRDPYAGLLPDEIERVLRDTGLAQDPEVRKALDRDFADYLSSKGRAVKAQPNARTSLWRTYDVVVGPLGTVGARMLVERLFAANANAKKAADKPSPRT
jgi:hypothetical protein